jgi:hypothetical protein
MEFCSAGSDDDERPSSSSAAENFPQEMFFSWIVKALIEKQIKKSEEK